MAKIGRNDPCPCGSGKKYKQCHGPIDAARESAQRQLRQAFDSLIVKVMDAAPHFAQEFPDALSRFWNDAHSVEEIGELDDLEERGAERFLTWFMFDHADATGQTPVQRLIADSSVLDLTPMEAQVLPQWNDVRLQPYAVTGVLKGRGLTVQPLRGDAEITVEDHAAARRVETGEVLIVHLTPAGDAYLLAGAAAHLTPDTVDQLEEWVTLHLENLQRSQPEATFSDLVHTQSEIFNHFVMALPREEQETNQLQALIDNTRVIMATTAASLGMSRPTEEPERLLVPRPDQSTAEDTADDAAEDVADPDTTDDEPPPASTSA